MPDREKVIKGLRDIDGFIAGRVRFEQAKNFMRTIDEAVVLLKEQEAQSVLSNRVCEAEPFRYVRKGFCPKCHQEMEWLFNRKHCGFCGKAVKWE